MKSSNSHFLAQLAVLICLAVATSADAVTLTINHNVETDLENRPFFPSGYSDGTVTYLNPAGYSGTGSPGDESTSVTGTGFGRGGDGTNNLPMGVGVNYGVTFDARTTTAGHKLSDGTQIGLGVNSSSVQAGDNTTQLSTGEQLLFDNLQLTNVSVYDPLGLLQAGTTVNTKWRALRSSDHASGDVAKTSSDEAGDSDVTLFNTATSIENNYDIGLISPNLANPELAGLSSPLYLTTTSGNWRLKGIRHAVVINYELNPTPPASRRTFMLGELSQTTQYEGNPSVQLTDIGSMDTHLTMTASGDGALLDTNDIGVGVNSTTDGTSTTDELALQRRIHGGISEAIHLSFDRDVSLESLTVGSVDLDGTEPVVLSFVSGTNPFTGLTGYSGEYTLDANSITFNRSLGGQTPYPITFGMNGQSALFIQAGTVLAVTGKPAVSGDYNGDAVVDAADYVLWRKNNINGTQGYTTWCANFAKLDDGGILLDMITVNLPATAAGTVDSFAAVPEPASALLLFVAVMACALGRFKRCSEST